MSEELDAVGKALEKCTDFLKKHIPDELLYEEGRELVLTLMKTAAKAGSVGITMGAEDRRVFAADGRRSALDAALAGIKNPSLGGQTGDWRRPGTGLVGGRTTGRPSRALGEILRGISAPLSADDIR